MIQLVRKLVYIVPMIMVGIAPLAAQIKDITELKARIPAVRDSTERVAVYARLGMLYTNRSLDSCYYFGARALDLAKRINDKAGQAEALNVLAFYYIEKANPYLAYKYINKSLMLFQRLKNRPKICEVTMNIGVLLSYEGKLDQALAQYRKAYELSTNLVQDSIKPLVLINLAMAQSFTPDPPDVIPLLNEAEQLAQKQGNGRFLMAARMTRNVTRFRSGTPPDQVIPDQYVIIEETKKYGYEYFTALASMELANMYLPVSVDSALHYFDLAINLAEATGYEGLHFQTMGQAYETLARIQPVPPQAAEYSRRLLELSRAKELENQKAGMDYLQLALKEQEIAAEQSKLRSRRLLAGSLVVICLLAVVSTVLVLRQYRKQRRLGRYLKDSNDQLEAKNKQLEDNDAFHQKLISIMSHDIRQPLSSILMLNEEGMVEHMSEVQRHYVFDQIGLSAKTSLQAMDGLVHWMKLNTIGLAYTPSVVNLRDNMLGALDYNRTIADKKSIATIDFVSESIEVLAQSEMLLFVNRNIINNAVRHTPEGGQIVVTARVDHEGGQAIVRIMDSGGGIPESVLIRLFDKERSETASAGSGLALIICHEMIEKMNGRIWAANNPEGGASFYYSLPISVPFVENPGSGTTAQLTL